MPLREELESQLLSDFCPPLDPAVCLAIFLDYDLEAPAQLQLARQTLAQLTEFADAEEASGFDPSGSGGGANIFSNDEDGSISRGLGSNTDATSLSHGLSSLDLDGVDSSIWSEAGEDDYQRQSKLELETLSADMQEAILLETFSALKPIDVKLVLKKHKGNASKAVEDLLFRVFLVENNLERRGVDGFFQEDMPTVRKKGRKKRKGKRQTWTSLDEQDYDDTPAPSVWDKSKTDVDFISTRLKLPPKQVASIYHHHGASLPATIVAILDGHPEILDGDALDPVLELHAHDLHREFPTLTKPLLTTLIHLTHPSTAAAHEVAQALAATTPAAGKIDLQLRYAPLPGQLASSAPPVRPYAHNAVHTSSSSYSPTAPAAGTDTDTAALLARRDQLWRQLASNVRRAKSHPLHAAARAHYSAEAAAATHQLRAAQRRAAEDLVARQSRRATAAGVDEIDLHGVTVADAARIAADRLAAWWARVGAADEAAHEGFRIVTGAGRHSQGGRSRIGPPVRRMLERGGWKFREGEGWFLVIGMENGRR